MLLDEDESLLGSHEPYTLAAAPDTTVTDTWPAIEAGTYEFVCTIHPGMNGAFIVA